MAEAGATEKKAKNGSFGKTRVVGALGILVIALIIVSALIGAAAS